MASGTGPTNLAAPSRSAPAPPIAENTTTELNAPNRSAPAPPTELTAPNRSAPAPPTELTAPKRSAPAPPKESTATSSTDAELTAPNRSAPAPPTELTAPNRSAPAPPTELNAPNRSAPAPPTELTAPKRSAPAPPTELTAPNRSAPAPPTELTAPKRSAPAPPPMETAPTITAPPVTSSRAFESKTTELTARTTNASPTAESKINIPPTPASNSPAPSTPGSTGSMDTSMKGNLSRSSSSLMLSMRSIGKAKAKWNSPAEAGPENLEKIRAFVEREFQHGERSTSLYADVTEDIQDAAAEHFKQPLHNRSWNPWFDAQVDALEAALVPKETVQWRWPSEATPEQLQTVTQWVAKEFPSIRELSKDEGRVGRHENEDLPDIIQDRASEHFQQAFHGMEWNKWFDSAVAALLQTAMAVDYEAEQLLEGQWRLPSDTAPKDIEALKQFLNETIVACGGVADDSPVVEIKAKASVKFSGQQFKAEEWDQWFQDAVEDIRHKLREAAREAEERIWNTPEEAPEDEIRDLKMWIDARLTEEGKGKSVSHANASKSHALMELAMGDKGFPDQTFEGQIWEVWFLSQVSKWRAKEKERLDRLWPLPKDATEEQKEEVRDFLKEQLEARDESQEVIEDEYQDMAADHFNQKFEGRPWNDWFDETIKLILNPPPPDPTEEELKKAKEEGKFGKKVGLTLLKGLKKAGAVALLAGKKVAKVGRSVAENAKKKVERVKAVQAAHEFNGHVSLIGIDNKGMSSIEQFESQPPELQKAWECVENDDLDGLVDLIREGVPINLARRLQTTPLHMASKNGNYEICKILIRGKANLNSQDRVGQIPLHLAMAEGKEKVAILLLKSGSSLYTPNVFGRTPYDYDEKLSERIKVFYTHQYSDFSRKKKRNINKEEEEL